jgi:NAD(P)-dependent dehydrogenase (short-subunit alcohol dehydrogenase family)
MTSDASRGVVLVTGGNSGIGYECARRLAREGCRVVIASRDRQASARAIERIGAETGSRAIEEMELDLGSLAGVRRFAKEVAARQLPVRALVCNAGLQLTRPRTSPDGFELTLAVNHLGHFLLVNLLLERLLANAPARIVVVASGVHDPKMKTGLPKPEIRGMDELLKDGGMGGGAYNGRRAYVHSKLANLWFTYELVRRIERAGLSSAARPLSVNAYEPGLVPGSGLARDYPAPLRWIWNNVLTLVTPILPMANTAERSGAALAGVVLDPALERTSGKYFPSHTQFAEGPSSDESYDQARARELWEASVRASGLRPEESPLARA